MAVCQSILQFFMMTPRKSLWICVALLPTGLTLLIAGILSFFYDSMETTVCGIVFLLFSIACGFYAGENCMKRWRAIQGLRQNARHGEQPQLQLESVENITSSQNLNQSLSTKDAVNSPVVSIQETVKDPLNSNDSSLPDCVKKGEVTDADVVNVYRLHRVSQGYQTTCETRKTGTPTTKFDIPRKTNEAELDSVEYSESKLPKNSSEASTNVVSEPLHNVDNTSGIQTRLTKQSLQKKVTFNTQPKTTKLLALFEPPVSKSD